MSRDSPVLAVRPAPSIGDAVALVASGAEEIDARLGGGLVRGALHEVYAGPDDACPAAGFALLLALRGSPARPVIWLREDRGERDGGRLYLPGLVELGVDPGAVLLVTAPDALALLRAGADSVACGAVGAVILEPYGAAPRLDLTASRRLALGAGRTGVMTLVVRSGVEPSPSAAATRWRVSAAPSRALGANAPGPPVFEISLLRHRGGIAGFDARVEWDRDRRSFADAPLSRRVPAATPSRALEDFGRRAA